MYMYICTINMCVHIYAYAYATLHYATVHCAKKPLHLLTSSCLHHVHYPCLIVCVDEGTLKEKLVFKQRNVEIKINDIN